ncbi:MAG: LuxR C-terminal-related transcriptional regulator [Dermatophilaceae bacterium]
MLIRVLLADDERAFRSGLRTVLDGDPTIRVVAEAGDEPGAVEAARRTEPDIVLMDVEMPGRDGRRDGGVGATRSILASGALAAAGPVPRIVALTTFAVGDYLERMLASGACGYLLKDTNPCGLPGLVRAIHRGDGALAPWAAGQVIDRLRVGLSGPPRPEPLRQDAGTPTLSPREAEVLALVADGADTREIGRSLHVTEETVRTHLRRVFHKLDVHTRAEAVATAYRLGLMREYR